MGDPGVETFGEAGGIDPAVGGDVLVRGALDVSPVCLYLNLSTSVCSSTFLYCILLYSSTKMLYFSLRLFLSASSLSAVFWANLATFTVKLVASVVVVSEALFIINPPLKFGLISTMSGFLPCGANA